MKTAEKETKVKTESTAENVKRTPFKKGDKTAGFWKTLFPYMKPFTFDCFSSPTMGLISVSISTRIIWMDGAPARSFTP